MNAFYSPGSLQDSLLNFFYFYFIVSAKWEHILNTINFFFALVVPFHVSGTNATSYHQRGSNRLYAGSNVLFHILIYLTIEQFFILPQSVLN